MRRRREGENLKEKEQRTKKIEGKKKKKLVDPRRVCFLSCVTKLFKKKKISLVPTEYVFRLEKKRD